MTGRRYRLLDLFCGAGGAAAGYHAAGFDVTGVDIAPQPDYPFPFLRADALSVDLSGWDVVHASPPCQRWSVATPAALRGSHPDLVAPVRHRLTAASSQPGGPRLWVIENVPGAPLHDPVLVCGDTLRLGVRRHREFESNACLVGTGCVHDRAGLAVPVYGSYGQRPHAAPGGPGTSAERGRAAMGIDWMPWPALTQAIPPAYTWWLGVQLAATLRRDAGPAGPAVPSPGDRTALGASVTPPGGPGDATRRRQTSPPTRPGGGTDTDDATPPAGIRHGHHHTEGSDQTTELAAAPRIGHCHCGRPLPPRPATGRWPRHCSHACRQAAYRARHTPPATASTTPHAEEGRPA